MADFVDQAASNLSGTASQSTAAKDNIDSNSGEKRLPPKASRQRFKPQLSCTFCRARKLKCDRFSPCNNCSKRDLSASCTYIHNSREKTSQIQRVRDRAKDVQERIRSLEDLVVALMNRTKDTKATPAVSSGFQPSAIRPRELSWPNDTSTTDSSDSIGRISVDDEMQNYVGGAHWTAILENIAGLKDSLGSEDWPQGIACGKDKYEGPELLFGDRTKASRESILSCLPSKPLADNLVERYFSAIDASFITHGPTFKKEYAEFWDSPDSKSISWIGLLFGIICLSANFELMTGDAPLPALSDMAVRETEKLIKVYREKMVQCLVTSNYTEPGLYTVQTLLLYYLSEYLRNKDAHIGTWMVFGMAIRAAMRLGMHRDASHYPNVSVFRGEMQRRLWGAILIIDIQSSCQVGLPRMISQGMYDTKPPSHILDEDLDENMIVLPPITTDYERSAIGHATFKYRVVLIFGKIFDASNLVTPVSYDEVMRLEKLLLDAVEETPEYFRARSIHALSSGSISQKVRRFSIEMTYLKSRCFLHRKFLSEAESLQKHSYSVKACVDSSMQILQYQNHMTNETAPGRPLHGMKWITSSLMTYDFLLAATLLCLYLGQLMATEGKSMHIRSLEFPIDWTKEDILHALLKSYHIWNNPELSSEDTMKFSKVLKAMLNKVGHWSTADKAQAEASKEVTNAANSGYLSNHDISNTYSLSPSNFEDSPSDSSNNIGMIRDILNDPTGLDWSLWDSNFQGSNTYIDAGSSLSATDPYFPFQAAGFGTNREGNQ